MCGGIFRRHWLCFREQGQQTRECGLAIGWRGLLSFWGIVARGPRPRFIPGESPLKRFDISRSAAADSRGRLRHIPLAVVLERTGRMPVPPMAESVKNGVCPWGNCLIFIGVKHAESASVDSR